MKKQLSRELIILDDKEQFKKFIHNYDEIEKRADMVMLKTAYYLILVKDKDNRNMDVLSTIVDTDFTTISRITSPEFMRSGEHVDGIVYMRGNLKKLIDTDLYGDFYYKIDMPHQSIYFRADWKFNEAIMIKRCAVYLGLVDEEKIPTIRKAIRLNNRPTNRNIKVHNLPKHK